MKRLLIKSSRDAGMIRLAISALGLLVVIPAMVIAYLFRDHLAGKEIALGLLLVIALLGFFLLFAIVRGISLVQKGLEGISRGETDTLKIDSGPTQLREMTEIINALNRLTIDFRENAAQLEHFIRQFATLTELTEVTAKVPEINDLLQLVLTKAMTASHARRGTVMLLREGSKILDIVATEGWTPTDTEPVALHETLAKRVIESGAPLLMENIQTSENIAPSEDQERYTSPSFLIMPLKSKTSVLGAVCLSEKLSGAPFTNSDQQFLTVLLGQIGFAVENANLLKQAREAAKDLKVRVQDQEIEIQDAHGRIKQAEKLSALGQLAGGVAHDFNNMLQAILGYTKLARQGLEPDTKRNRDLEQVRKAAERAATLTSQLLAFGRRQVLQPVDLDLNNVIADVMQMLTRVIGEHIEIKFEDADDLQTVNADPRQVEQVLMNLCINARDAMPGGGNVLIETSNVTLDSTFCESRPMVQPGPYVQFTVTDEGSGMDDDILSQVFEPFFTTKDVGKGTGLGLATVYGIVKQHNGLVEVSSEVGKGSVFSVFLPSTDRPPATVEKREEIGESTGTEVILVAEDEETVRNLNVCVLEEAGYTVLSAEDGEVAVQVFSENADRISLALIDAVMPKLTGREVYNRIKEINPSVRVLFSSGYSQDAVTTGFIHEDELPLIQKPFDPDELLATIREILDMDHVV